VDSSAKLFLVKLTTQALRFLVGGYSRVEIKFVD
jgi:hypothetical protein